MRTYPDYPEEMTVNHDSPPIRRFAAAMLLNAQRDSEGRHGVDFEQRVKAVAWLASKRATLYFDTAGFTQSRALLRSNWRDNALEVLYSERLDSGDLALYLGNQLDVISDSLDYLNSLEERLAP